MSPSSFYRRITEESESRIVEITNRVSENHGVHLQWVDNYARFISRSSMFLNQEMFRQCYWTAHAFKVFSFLICFLKLLLVFRFW